jgi:hypothetical protein
MNRLALEQSGYNRIQPLLLGFPGKKIPRVGWGRPGAREEVEVLVSSSILRLQGGGELAEMFSPL